jgi:pSer/pThr/pTyr-binding forkhead associated (FHA) protein
MREDIPILVSPEGEMKGNRWSLDLDDFVIGRDPTCHLVISDRQISRYHVRVRKTSGGYTIEDLGSKNGTYLNGKQLLEIETLQDGDEIQVALALKLIFVGSEATIPLTLESMIEVIASTI